MSEFAYPMDNDDVRELIIWVGIVGLAAAAGVLSLSLDLPFENISASVPRIAALSGQAHHGDGNFTATEAESNSLYETRVNEETRQAIRAEMTGRGYSVEVRDSGVAYSKSSGLFHVHQGVIVFSDTAPSEVMRGKVYAVAVRSKWPIGIMAFLFVFAGLVGIRFYFGGRQVAAARLS